MVQFNKSIQARFIFAALLITFNSCGEKFEHPVPSVFVNFTININTDPEYLPLLAPDNAVLINPASVGQVALGYDNNGIILYRSDNILAFDRTCPFDMPKSVQVELYGNNMARCPECGTEYILSGMGSPTTDGPGSIPLKEYRTTFNINTGDVHVFN